MGIFELEGVAGFFMKQKQQLKVGGQIQLWAELWAENSFWVNIFVESFESFNVSLKKKSLWEVLKICLMKL